MGRNQNWKYMKKQEYRFECMKMSCGWCLVEDEPGCLYDCPLKKCENCIHSKCPGRREPCSGCWLNDKDVK